MSKNILFSGKEYSKDTDIQNLATNYGINPLITSSAIVSNDSEGLSSQLSWNKASPISAHSIIVKSENEVTTLDGAVLFFDALSYNSDFLRNTIDEFTRGTDEMILSYTYLATELIKRFSDKRHGKLFFVLQNAAAKTDIFQNGQNQDNPNDKLSTIVAMAQASFKVFAENMAFDYYRNTGSFIYLLQANSSVSEDEIIKFVSEETEKPLAIYKSIKNAITWIDLSGKSKFSFPFINK